MAEHSQSRWRQTLTHIPNLKLLVKQKNVFFAPPTGNIYIILGRIAQSEVPNRPFPSIIALRDFSRCLLGDYYANDDRVRHVWIQRAYCAFRERYRTIH